MIVGVGGGVLIGVAVDAVLRRVLAHRGAALKSMDGYVPPHVPDVETPFTRTDSES